MNALMQENLTISTDRRRITQVIAYLTESFELRPTLDQAAEVAGFSNFQFSRFFMRVVGVSAEKFIHHLTLTRAKEDLLALASVRNMVHDVGRSRPGRLYDLFVSHESLTPSEWSARSAAKDIVYGWHPSPFGECLIVASERGVCGMAFELEEGHDATVDNLFTSLGGARRKEHPAATKQYADRAFDGGDLKVVLRGTPFQLKVWQGLLRIPSGAVISYEGLARALCRPTAARAVAGAIARNPVSWLVPCHRVLRGTGAIAGYRWGPNKKRSMLAYEAAALDEKAV